MASFALLIGIDVYAATSGLPPLRTAVDTARALAAWLAAEEWVAPAQIRLLCSPHDTTRGERPATRAAITEALMELQRAGAETQPGDRLFFLFAGQSVGYFDEQLLLLPHDSVAGALGARALPWAELHHWLCGTGFKMQLCFLAVGSVVEALTADALIDARLPVEPTDTHTAWADVEQRRFVSIGRAAVAPAEDPPAIFSRVLHQGLAGAAGVSVDHATAERVVRVEALSAYLEREIPRSSEYHQRCIIAGKGGENSIVAWLGPAIPAELRVEIRPVDAATQASVALASADNGPTVAERSGPPFQFSVVHDTLYSITARAPDYHAATVYGRATGAAHVIWLRRLDEGTLSARGRSLAEKLSSEGALPLAVVLRIAAQTAEGQYLALGAVWPGPNLDPTAADLRLPPDVLVSSWESLASRLASHVQRRVVGVTTLIALALVFFLWLAFRNWREVVLGLLALVLSLTLLLAVMSLAGWTWNLLSLVALPLLLGSSVDSTIHMQLALRRHRGDRAAVWRTTGKALRLCAAANIAGFGSLAWSSNLGLASLDLICATGVGCVFTVCVGLLPSWWRRFASDTKVIAPRPAAPSALYGVTLWRAGQRLGYGLPEGLAQTLASTGATLYRWFRPTRFAVVVANLQPIVGGDGSAAVRAARQNFRQFAAKLVDLWRYEAGVSFENRLHPAAGWNHFSTALNSGRGVLLVTPHLGNWEFGAPLLRRHGQRPLVLTAPEPGGQFTEIRAAARALQGIDTLVVGEDPFAFVEVIRRLQDGGVVALLVDRPPAATAVEVPFFGRPFQASIAVAELARATGAVVLPVFIVRDVHGYQAHALEPVAYDRRALGTRAARVALTAEILRAFEPVIRQFPDQWFHFVPVWDVTEQTPPAS